MNIIELVINDDEELSGVDAISVVEEPAIEEDFIALSKQQIKLAEVKKEYVYSIVDSPSIPISRYGVPRSLICIFITLSGFFLSLVFVMVRSLIKRW